MTAPGGSENIGGVDILVTAESPNFAEDVLAEANEVGRKVSDSLANGFKKAANGFKTAVIGVATAAGVAAGAVISKAVSRGLSRLAGLDTAEARFKGLTIVGEQLADIMSSVDKAVTDTAFGLDSAAKSASMLATSGVKAGQQMDLALKALVTLGAAAGNTDADLDSMTAIMQKVAADSRQMGMAIRQLQIHGINATSALAQSFKVTEGEIRQMVKDGAISFDQFNRAVVDSLGGMALAMGQTAEAMQTNLVSRMGRAAANIAQPFVEGKKQILSALLPKASELANVTAGWTSQLTDRLRPVFDQIAKLIERIDFSKLNLDSAISGMKAAVPLLGGLAGALGGVASRLPLIGGAFAGLTGPIGMLVAAVGGALLASSEFRGLLGTLMSALAPLIPPIMSLMGAVSSLATSLLNALVPAISQVIEWLQPLLGLIGKIVEAFSWLIGKVSEAVSFVGDIFKSNKTAAEQSAAAWDMAKDSAKRLVRGVGDLSSTLDKNTSTFTKNTKEAIANYLATHDLLNRKVDEDGGTSILAQLRQWGVDSAAVTEGILGDAAKLESAFDQINDAMGRAAQQTLSESGIADLLKAAGVSAKEVVNDFEAAEKKIIDYFQTINAEEKNLFDAGQRYNAQREQLDALRKIYPALTEDVKVYGTAMEFLGTQQDAAKAAVDRDIEARIAQGEILGKFGTRILVNAEQWGKLASEMAVSGDSAEDLMKRMRDLGYVSKDSDAALREAANAAIEAGNSFDVSGSQAESAADRIKGYRDALLGIGDGAVEFNTAVSDMYEGIDSLGQIMYDSSTEAQKLGESLFDAQGNLDLSSANARKLQQEMVKYRATSAQMVAAILNETGSMEQAQAAADALRQGFINMATQQLGINVPAAQTLANQLNLLSGIRIGDLNFSVNARDNATAVLARTFSMIEFIRNPGASMAKIAGAIRQVMAAQTVSFGGFTPNITIPSIKGGGGGSAGGGRSSSGGGSSALSKSASKAASDMERALDKVLSKYKKDAGSVLDKLRKKYDSSVVALPQIASLTTQAIRDLDKQVKASNKAINDAAKKGLDPARVKELRNELKEFRAASIESIQEASRREYEENSKRLADIVEKALGNVGKVASKPFELASVGLKKIAADITTVRNRINDAVKQGLDPAYVRPLAKELSTLVAEAQKQLSALRKKIVGENLSAVNTAVKGSVEDMHRAMTQLIDDLRAVGASSSTLKTLASYEKQLASAMTKRADIQERLADAQNRLTEATNEYQGQLESVRNTMVSSLGIGSLITREVDNSLLGVDALVLQLQERVDAAELYSKSLEKLKKAGLNEDLWNQLVESGPSASEQAAILAQASTSQLAEINKLAEKAFKEGEKLGKSSADTLYGDGVKAAKALVDGLKSQESAVQKTISSLAGNVKVLTEKEMKSQGVRAIDGFISGMKSMSDALDKAGTNMSKVLLDAMKKELKISSPSQRIADEVGAPAIMGVVKGMNDNVGKLKMPLGSLLDPPRFGSSGGGYSRGGSAQQELVLILRGDGEITDILAREALVQVGKTVGATQLSVRRQGVSKWL